MEYNKYEGSPDEAVGKDVFIKTLRGFIACSVTAYSTRSTLYQVTTKTGLVHDVPVIYFPAKEGTSL